MKLVCVHGRSQAGNDAEEMRLFWEGCLARAFQDAGLAWPAGLEVVLPFYADDLERMVQQVNSPLVTDILLRGEEPTFAPNDLQIEMLREMLEEQPLTTPLPLQPVERGPQNWPFVLAMLRALDQTPLGGDAIDKITRDVWVYLTYGGIRRRVDDIVAAAIPNESCIVVAHSLGSIVAYNVLSKRGSGPLLITLGSPLGMKSVTAQLKTPLAHPPGFASWFNARDKRDVVALRPLDATHFGIQPAIENHSAVNNLTNNRHSIEGYLSDPQVARRIHDAAT